MTPDELAEKLKTVICELFKTFPNIDVTNLPNEIAVGKGNNREIKQEEYSKFSNAVTTQINFLTGTVGQNEISISDILDKLNVQDAQQLSDDLGCIQLRFENTGNANFLAKLNISGHIFTAEETHQLVDATTRAKRDVSIIRIKYSDFGAFLENIGISELSDDNVFELYKALNKKPLVITPYKKPEITLANELEPLVSTDFYNVIKDVETALQEALLIGLTSENLPDTDDPAQPSEAAPPTSTQAATQFSSSSASADTIIQQHDDTLNRELDTLSLIFHAKFLHAYAALSKNTLFSQALLSGNTDDRFFQAFPTSNVQCNRKLEDVAAYPTYDSTQAFADNLYDTFEMQTPTVESYADNDDAMPPEPTNAVEQGTFRIDIHLKCALTPSEKDRIKSVASERSTAPNLAHPRDGFEYKEIGSSTPGLPVMRLYQGQDQSLNATLTKCLGAITKGNTATGYYPSQHLNTENYTAILEAIKATQIVFNSAYTVNSNYVLPLSHETKCTNYHDDEEPLPTYLDHLYHAFGVLATPAQYENTATFIAMLDKAKALRIEGKQINHLIMGYVQNLLEHPSFLIKETPEGLNILHRMLDDADLDLEAETWKILKSNIKNALLHFQEAEKQANSTKRPFGEQSKSESESDSDSDSDSKSSQAITISLYKRYARLCYQLNTLFSKTKDLHLQLQPQEKAFLDGTADTLNDQAQVSMFPSAGAGAGEDSGSADKTAQSGAAAEQQARQRRGATEKVVASENADLPRAADYSNNSTALTNSAGEIADCAAATTADSTSNEPAAANTASPAMNTSATERTSKDKTIITFTHQALEGTRTDEKKHLKILKENYKGGIIATGQIFGFFFENNYNKASKILAERATARNNKGTTGASTKACEVNVTKNLPGWSR